jgi:CBS domain-containing protein
LTGIKAAATAPPRLEAATAEATAMRASEIGTARVIHAPAALTLRDAACLMRRQQVGCLVVVREDDSMPVPVGIVTDRDLVTEAIAASRDLDSTTLGQVMSAPLATCRADATLAEVVGILRGSGVRRLPLVDGEGSLVGVVSADDVLVAITELLGRLAEAMMVEPLLDRSYT